MRIAFIVLAALPFSCVGGTGGETLDFDAAASGPSDARAGQALVFDAAHGWHVSLQSARLHVGALYLADSAPVSGAQDTSCQLPGSYIAEVREGLDVDLLSSTPQPFPVRGKGITGEALAAQIWLTSGDVNVIGDPPRPAIILELSGTATRNAEARPFQASLTIAGNRIVAGGGAAGGATICKQRIVTRQLALQVEAEGVLRLRIDPRRLFSNVDFGALSPDGDGYVFHDDDSDQPSANLYNNLRSGDSYQFSWEPRLE
jgi:hypothetical protein